MVSMAESVVLYRSWTVDQLKAFLQERWVPLSGNKEQLVKKVADRILTGMLSVLRMVKNSTSGSFHGGLLSNSLLFIGAEVAAG